MAKKNNSGKSDLQIAQFVSFWLKDQSYSARAWKLKISFQQMIYRIFKNKLTLGVYVKNLQKLNDKLNTWTKPLGRK